jgi:beta-xylosidase
MGIRRLGQHALMSATTFSKAALTPLWLGLAVAALNGWAQTSTPPALPKVEPDPDKLVHLASRGIRAHDPSTIVKCGGEYWLFATGNGIVSWRSKDLLTWAAGPRVFTNPPAWTTNMVPGNRGYFWAPDVIHVGNRFLLYYSVSTWARTPPRSAWPPIRRWIPRQRTMPGLTPSS